MPVVSEMVHPKGFDFATQRQIVLLREVRKLKWEDIAKQVKNLQGENPLPRLCANYYHEFSRRLGRRRARYDRCGNKPSKVTPQVEQFLVKQLKVLRRTCVCTSTTLQQVLAQDMGVKLTDRYVRKLLQKKGYRWLPRRQKRVYSTIQKAERLKFAKHVVSLSKAQLREKLSLAMDGVVLGIPPADPTDRMNFCRYGDEYMWRKRSEAFQPELAGQDSYGSYIPLARTVPLWGGCSEGGFSVVLFHSRKKLNKAEWVHGVQQNKLTDAIKKLKPVKAVGPWHVLCDNEGFMKTRDSQVACKAKGVKLWHIPAKSPDLNPVERFWAWLRKKLRQMDLADAVARRPVLGKMAYKARIRGVIKSRKAQQVAAAHAASLRKVCKEVIAKKGAASSG